MLANSTQTSYRLGASMSVDSLVGAVEADPANYTCYTYPTVSTDTKCATANAYISTWVAGVNTLKGSGDNPPSSVLDAATGNLTISVYWKLPQEKSDVTPHSLIAIVHPIVGSGS